MTALPIKRYMKNGEPWVKTTRNITAKYELKPNTTTEDILKGLEPYFKPFYVSGSMDVFNLKVAIEKALNRKDEDVREALEKAFDMYRSSSVVDENGKRIFGIPEFQVNARDLYFRLNGELDELLK